MNDLKLFFKLLAVFFGLLQKTSEDYEIAFFICLEQLLYVKFFSWKTKEFGNFSRNLVQFFLKFWRQNRILVEKRQHSCQNSTLRIRRDLLGKHMFSRKKSNE